jgi:putative membrane protein
LNKNLRNNRLKVKLQTISGEERTRLAHERNLLANDRTFLAWIRTGLAGVGGGIVIIRYLTFHNATHQMLAELVGLIFVLWSIAIFVLALFGYRRSHKNLKIKDTAFIGSTYIVTLLVLT